MPAGTHGVDEWREVDLFSLLDVERKSEAVDTAIYLVHSMMPSARLTQGAFQDMDLIAADNFARAMKKVGTKRILYLGGIVPESEKLSSHLKSRLEVEQALGAYGIPVVSLRAGLIIGSEGSSAQILLRLVNRLPVMICPRWTQNPSQPIAGEDVVKIILYCLSHPELPAGNYDIGGPEVLTYKEMLEQIADVFHKKRFLIPTRVNGLWLSHLWVSGITGAPRDLVKPLVASLQYSLCCRDRRLQEEAGIPGHTFRDTIQKALTKLLFTPVAFQGSKRLDTDRKVRSVQRLSLPASRNADWVARSYLYWLPRHLWPLLKVTVSGERTATFRIVGLSKPLLVLEYSPERSSSDRALLYIRGGLLTLNQGRGRLEFRDTVDKDSVLVAIHDYEPRLPWPLYRWSQALVHGWVMGSFGRYLRKNPTELPPVAA